MDILLKVRALSVLGDGLSLPAKLANLSLNRLERWLGRTRLRSMPLGADIVTTRRCNCRCLMCIGYSSEPPLEMPIPLFEALARRLFPTLLYVRFASGGEHLLHPHFRAMLRRCRQYGCPVTVVSNGTLIDGDWADFLVRASSVWSLTISFDGARPETFNAIRRGALFDRVTENVRRLAAVKRERRSVFPILSLRFVAMRRNIEELPQLVSLAADLDVNQVQVAYLIVSPGVDEQESLWHHQSLAASVFEKARVAAVARGIDLRLPVLFSAAPGGMSPSPCALPWTQLYVDPSGSLGLCCNAWDDFPALAHFAGAEFHRAWNSERYMAVRRSLAEGRPLYARCRNCPAIGADPSDKTMHFL